MRSFLAAASVLLMAQAPIPPVQAVIGAPPAMLSMPTLPVPQAAMPGHAATGNAPLDQALALCDSHQGYPALVRGSRGATTPTWQSGYEGCAQIVPLWQAGAVTLSPAQQATVAAFLVGR